MKKATVLFIWLVLAPAFLIGAESMLDIKLNFFGPATGDRGAPAVATSFYIQSVVQRNLQVQFAADALLAELRRTFNAPDLSLLASGELHWSSAGDPMVTQVVQIDGRDFAIGLTPRPGPGAVGAQVVVVEKNLTREAGDVLLDTEILLPDGEVATLGFRDSQDRSYFIAFYVQGRSDEFGKDAVRLARGAKPRQVRHVDPLYPAEALQKKIQGVVVLEAVAGIDGRVRDVRVATPCDPLLDAAAAAAVRQWLYEPYQVDGKAKEVLFTVTVTFALAPEAGAGKKEGGSARIRGGGSQRPRKVKDVRPVYPAEAAKNGIEGVVVLEAVCDEKGKVKDVRVTSAPNPFLDQAAVEAVKQWEYEPFIVKGKAQAVVFTVTVNFSLAKK